VTEANASRRQYEARMHRVQAHIDRHLDEPLDLEALAAVAHFSPYHFHRLFLAWMGETLGDYLTRRRLERGAQRLRGQPGSTVLSIALSVGYGSAEAFSRAFKARFGFSPTQWRKLDQADSNLDQAGAWRDGEHGFSRNPDEGDPVNVRLIDRDPVRMAYLRYQGAYGPALGRFWAETFNPWLATQNLGPVARFGIGHDDPSLVPPEQCRYDAGMAVPEGWMPNGGAIVTELPGGRYAVLGFEGTAAEIGAAWSALMGQWLPSSGLQLDARPCFEHYGPASKFDFKTGVFDCELCIPVAHL
jgi:AraC family transcriptional regulator